jgi:hypothetical protein
MQGQSASKQVAETGLIKEKDPAVDQSMPLMLQAEVVNGQESILAWLKCFSTHEKDERRLSMTSEDLQCGATLRG